MVLNCLNRMQKSARRKKKVREKEERKKGRGKKQEISKKKKQEARDQEGKGSKKKKGTEQKRESKKKSTPRRGRQKDKRKKERGRKKRGDFFSLLCLRALWSDLQERERLCCIGATDKREFRVIQYVLDNVRSEGVVDRDRHHRVGHRGKINQNPWETVLKDRRGEKKVNEK